VAPHLFSVLNPQAVENNEEKISPSEKKLKKINKKLFSKGNCFPESRTYLSVLG
jgi:hypothetical protein